MNPSYIIQRLLGSLMVIGLLATADLAHLQAAQPANGYFTGVELEPLSNATIEDAQQEPAVVLMFSINQKTADITRQFEEWYSSPSRPKVGVFAVAVDPDNLSREIILEAIKQRNLTMPVLLASTDILLGDDFRLSVLDDDQETKRFTTLDFAGINEGLSSLGIFIPAQLASPAPVPTPAPAVTGTNAGEPIILGGPGGESVYRNERYGFTIEFPPSWKYRVAANQDGAVAISPASSRLDMRAWATTSANPRTAQQYIDKTLDNLARKNRTRVQVQRRLSVLKGEASGMDITYTYTRPLDPGFPAVGSMLYRGRMQIFVEGDVTTAASVEGPGGEFTAATPLVESFFRKFTPLSLNDGQARSYNSPNI